MHDVLALILAGGKATRLELLTHDRAKPAVPFGGASRNESKSVMTRTQTGREAAR